MDWVIGFVGDVVFWGVGAVVVLALSLGILRPAPVKAELSSKHPHHGRFFYVHNGQRFVSIACTQAIGAIVLIAASLVLWSY